MGNKTNLAVVNFGLALGFITALGTLLLGWAATWFGWGEALVELTSNLYIGYSASFGGAIIGAIWGFIDGFIGGALIAWLYNKFQD